MLAAAPTVVAQTLPPTNAQSVSSKKVLRTAADLPPFTYPMTGTAQALLESDDATFNAFASRVRSDLESVFRDYDIQDKGVLLHLLSDKLDLQTLFGDDADALNTCEQMRLLFDQPAMKATGMFNDVTFLKARMTTGQSGGERFQAEYEKNFRSQVDSLPWAVVAERVGKRKADFERLSVEYVAAKVRADVEPFVSEHHALDFPMATRLIFWRGVLLTELPQRQIVLDVLSVYIKEHDAPRPPAAPVRPVTDDYFGTKVVDDYRWMEEPGNADLAAWMKAQNDYTRSVLSRLDAPRVRLLARLKDLDNAVPVVAGVTRAGPYLFFRQTNPGARTSSLMVRGPDGTTRTLLDPEKFTEKESHAAMDYVAPSADGALVVVGVSLGGSENSTIRVVETKTGRILPDAITRTQYGSPSWRADGRSFYYSRLQALTRDAPPTAIYENEKTFLHVIGEDPEKDRAVFGPGVSPGVPVPVAGFGAVFATPGCPFVGASWSAGTTNPPDIYVAPADRAVDERTPWKKIVASEDELAVVDSPAAVFGSTLYLLMQKGTPNRRLVSLDLNHPDLSRARVLLPESDVVLDGIYAAADGLYVLERVGVGFRLARIRYEASGEPETIALPYPGAVLAVDANVQLSGAVFVLGSWTRPESAFLYDSATGRSADLGIMPRHPADFSKIEAREVFVPSTDGAQVPASILCAKDIRLDGSHTAVLEGYGAYGISIDPFFEPKFLPLLERGGVVVFVHARGGGEFGEKWHLAGQKATKQHTIDDVVATARYLIERKYTSPQHLAVLGTSAGGIPVGGAITQHPELFAAAVDNVGMTDLLRFQTTQGGAANIPEFGDVGRPGEYEWLYRISAYHHVSNGTRYPAVMGVTGVNDPRVPSWIVAKFIARLQAASGSGKPVLLRVDYDAGHGLGSNRTQREEQIADEAAFILWQTGYPEFQPR